MHLGSIIQTLLDGVEYINVNWEQGLNDKSDFFYDYMLKDMCLGSQVFLTRQLTECVDHHTVADYHTIVTHAILL